MPPSEPLHRGARSSGTWRCFTGRLVPSVVVSSASIESAIKKTTTLCKNVRYQSATDATPYPATTEISESLETRKSLDYLLQMRRGPRQLSRYRDSLRDVRSGDRSLVGARFSAHDQTGPGAHPASYTMVPNLFLGGKATREWR